MKTMKEKIYTDTEIGEIRLVKNARSRRLSIRVHPVRGVTVTIPWLMRYDDGMKFFLRKRDWVLSTVRRQGERLRQAEKDGMAVSSIHDGTVVRTLLSEIVFVRDVPAAGHPSGIPGAFGVLSDSSSPLRISVRSSLVEDVKLTGRLYLSLDRPISRKEVHYPCVSDSPALSTALMKALVKILCDEARSLLPVKLRFFAERYGFCYNGVTIKHNSSNWGSCSTLGNINLNLNLVRLPEPVCDYVLLHELAHLRHHDHGPEFHDLLERLCSDNLTRLSSLGDPYVTTLFSSARRSRASRPFSRILSLETKKYRLL